MTKQQELMDYILRKKGRKREYTRCDEIAKAKHYIYRLENGGVRIVSKVYDMDNLTDYPFKGFTTTVNAEAIRVTGEYTDFKAKDGVLIIKLPRCNILREYDSLPLYKEESK